METYIRYPSAFARWADKNFGIDWYKNSELIETYGVNRIKNIYFNFSRFV